MWKIKETVFNSSSRYLSIKCTKQFFYVPSVSCQNFRHSDSFPQNLIHFVWLNKICREKILMHTFDIFIEIEGRRDRNRKMKVPKWEIDRKILKFYKDLNPVNSK
jgi:hypothetical protein